MPITWSQKTDDSSRHFEQSETDLTEICLELSFVYWIWWILTLSEYLSPTWIRVPCGSPSFFEECFLNFSIAIKNISSMKTNNVNKFYAMTKNENWFYNTTSKDFCQFQKQNVPSRNMCFLFCSIEGFSFCVIFHICIISWVGSW